MLTRLIYFIFQDVLSGTMKDVFTWREIPNLSTSSTVPSLETKLCRQVCSQLAYLSPYSVADPGFPIGGPRPIRGRRLPRRLCFENCVYWNERTRTLGGAAPGTPPWSDNVIERFVVFTSALIANVVPLCCYLRDKFHTGLLSWPQGLNTAVVIWNYFWNEIIKHFMWNLETYPSHCTQWKWRIFHELTDFKVFRWISFEIHLISCEICQISWNPHPQLDFQAKWALGFSPSIGLS